MLFIFNTRFIIETIAKNDLSIRNKHLVKNNFSKEQFYFLQQLHQLNYSNIILKSGTFYEWDNQKTFILGKEKKVLVAFAK